MTGCAGARERTKINICTLFILFVVVSLPSRSLPLLRTSVPANSPSRGGDAVQLILPTPFDSVLVSISVFMALSSAFHSTNCSHNSPVSCSVLPVLSLPY